MTTKQLMKPASRLAAAAITVEPVNAGPVYAITLRIVETQNPDFIGDEVEVKCSIRDKVSVYEFSSSTVPVMVNEFTTRQGQIARIQRAYDQLEVAIAEASELDDDERSSFGEFNVEDGIRNLEAKDAGETIAMPRAVVEALREVIDYVAPDEKRDWERDGGGSGGHIWHSIKPVCDWLDENEEVAKPPKAA
jgi:hypothetical protein